MMADSPVETSWAEDPSQPVGIQLRAEGRGQLAHPEHVAEGDGDLPGFEVEDHTFCGGGQDLVLDDVGRPERRMPGEGYLPSRRKDPDVVAAVALLI
jgi:hypothetical protein